MTEMMDRRYDMKGIYAHESEDFYVLDSAHSSYEGTRHEYDDEYGSFTVQVNSVKTVVYDNGFYLCGYENFETSSLAEEVYGCYDVFEEIQYITTDRASALDWLYDEE